MGSGGMKSQIQSKQTITLQPNVVMSQQQAQSLNDATFSATDAADFHQLYNGRQYFASQNFNIDTQMAIQDYLNDQTMVGSLYSPSQVLNHKMEKGMKLTVAEQAMVDSLNEGMHNIGYNINLTRFGRVGYLDTFGKHFANGKINANNFENMTESQLKQAFVGKSYVEDKFVSTSYNDFKNAPNGGRPFTDKAVKFTIQAPAKTQALMPGNGPGGALGEIILKPGQTYKIKDVKFTGKQGRSGSSYYKQIEFIVEVV